jgi:hypothetical protein
MKSFSEIHRYLCFCIYSFFADLIHVVDLSKRNSMDILDFIFIDRGISHSRSVCSSNKWSKIARKGISVYNSRHFQNFNLTICSCKKDEKIIFRCRLSRSWYVFSLTACFRNLNWWISFGLLVPG